MKHTTKLLLTMVVTLVTVIGLCGCPSPVNDYADTHEHIWELVEEVKPTCTTKGTKTYKCKLCEETKVEEVSALGHDFQGGYCERCGKYEFEKHIEIKVFTDIENFCNFMGRTKGINNIEYDTIKGSFEESITVNELLHSKSRYHNYNIVVDKGTPMCFEYISGADVSPNLKIDEKFDGKIAILVEIE